MTSDTLVPVWLGLEVPLAQDKGGGGRSIWKLSLIFPSHTRVHPLTEKQKDASVPLGPGQSVVKSKQLCNQRKTVTI